MHARTGTRDTRPSGDTATQIYSREIYALVFFSSGFFSSVGAVLTLAWALITILTIFCSSIRKARMMLHGHKRNNTDDEQTGQSHSPPGGKAEREHTHKQPAQVEQTTQESTEFVSFQ